MLCLQCQTAVIELILTLIRKNNAVFPPPEHGEGFHLGHARLCATGVPCSQKNIQSRLCENGAPPAAPLVPGQSADAWAVSQLASAPWQKQSFFRYGNSHRPLEVPCPPRSRLSRCRALRGRSREGLAASNRGKTGQNRAK